MTFLSIKLRKNRQEWPLRGGRLRPGVDLAKSKLFFSFSLKLTKMMRMHKTSQILFQNEARPHLGGPKCCSLPFFGEVGVAAGFEEGLVAPTWPRLDPHWKQNEALVCFSRKLAQQSPLEVRRAERACC